MLTYKVLGQVVPSATTLSTLYTTPSSTSTVISTIVATNRGSSSSAFRIAVRPGGASIDNKHYLVYDSPLDANSFLTLTIGITLSAGDVVSVYAGTDDFSFNAFGSEVS